MKNKPKRIPPKCPTHNVRMDYTATRYGPRYDCPVKDCTVALWGDSDTATPADYETRQARLEAHDFFDSLWRCGRFKRKALYAKLAGYLGLKTKDTHIGLFTKEQCDKVRLFIAELEAK